MSTPVAELPHSCTYEGTSCAKSADVPIGLCRTIQFSSAGGAIQVQVCDKGDRYELYRTANPGGDMQVCVGGGCVDEKTGFARYTGTALADSTTAPSSTGTTTTTDPSSSAGTSTLAPAQPPTNTACALVSPASTGFAGESRSNNYDRLVRSWLNEGNLMQTVQCSQGTCLWVPWYTTSSSCQTGDLQRGSNCKLSTVDMQNNCLVTDEFSQVGMVLAMSGEQAKFDQFFNTVKELKSDKFGTLTVWRASRSANSINKYYTSNQDTASDADARIIIALYVAANSERFTPEAKSRYRAHADQMAADLVKYDFDKTCRPGRNGKEICNWLGSGSMTGTSRNIGSEDYTFGGYFGDVILAMLAAYSNTGNPTYLKVAQDTAENYLLASDYKGSFRVPPKAFKWDTSSGTPKAVCTEGCTHNAWDDADAVRATTVCKSLYYASLNNVDLGADLASYCNQWMQSGGVTSNQYSIQYYFDGKPYQSPQRGYYQNGLGASLNFYANQGGLATRLDEALGHYDLGTESFDRQACMGVYRSAFPIVSLGSAIGRDTRAFGQACGTTAPTGAPTTAEPVTAPTAPTTETDKVPYVTPTQQSEPEATPTQTSLSASDEVRALTVVSVRYPNGPQSSLVSDYTKGGCRTLQYDNPDTFTQVQICDKGSSFEMYLQTPRTNGETTTCVGSHCVGPKTGFARW